MPQDLPHLALGRLTVVLLLALGYACRTGGDQLPELLDLQLPVHSLDRGNHRFLPDSLHLKPPILI